MSRFKVSKENLTGYIQDAIFVIEIQTPLRFVNAQDWTEKNQGWVLEMQCEDCYVIFAEQSKIEFTIKAQFCHNPGIKCKDEDTSDFEELEYKGNNQFNIYLNN